MMKAERRRREATARLAELTAENTRLIAELEAFIARPAPECVTWAHAGTAEHIHERLRDLTDCLYNRGEYAD